jgi:hypothetical protein
LINEILTITIIKKIMACKNCKKNAKSVVKQLKSFVKGEKLEPKTKTPCETKRKKEQDWLDTSEEGKQMKAFSKLNRPETFILIFLAWIPLFVGYFTIVKFIISLF